MGNPDNLKEINDTEDNRKLIESYIRLQKQRENPSRTGMVEALSGAQKIAREEITILEKKQGDIYLTPWYEFPDNDLYRKLSQYQLGLYNHAIKKIGKDTFEKLLQKYSQM